MNKLRNKNDFKLLMTFFALETVMLLICAVISHYKVNGGKVYAVSDAAAFAVSSRSVRENILLKSFGGTGVNAFESIGDNADYDTITPGNGNELYKYYTFNLTDNGVTSNLTRAEAGAKMSGIANNTATSTVIEPAKSTFKLGNLTVENRYVHESLDLVSILEKPLVIEPMDRSGILIYHVHATEGYCATESEKFDVNEHVSEGETNNVVYIGNTLRDTIAAKTGISVLHDKTVFKEGVTSDIAYNNAALRLNEIYSENKNVKLQIDLHRNSAVSDNAKFGPVVEAGGVRYAQFSFVIGLDWDPITGDRSESANPYWEDNFKLCMLVIEKLDEKVPGIVRQIELRRNPYNQNFVENSLLVEIGFDGNLTSEADSSSRLFGEVLSDIYG